MRKVTEAGQALTAAVAGAGTIDWQEPRLALQASAQVIERIMAQDGLIAAAAREVLAGSDGASACESFDHLDKLVLWQSPDRSLRLRLHLFFPGYLDRPHNHRWSFVSRVLRGRYLHALYGEETQVLSRAQRGRPPVIRHAYQVGAGSEYFLDHTLVHSLSTAELTASLVLRGPAVKDRYFTLDPEAGQVRWSLGAEREPAQARAAKSMTAAGFARVSRALAELGVL